MSRATTACEAWLRGSLTRTFQNSSCSEGTGLPQATDTGFWEISMTCSAGQCCTHLPICTRHSAVSRTPDRRGRAGRVTHRTGGLEVVVLEVEANEPRQAQLQL
jgi:hypothetical protein